jgi:V/A-type H+/Na+-transporting ATPase subunit K
MLLMKNAIKAGTVSPISALGIGIFVGLALLISSVFQGKAAATAIQASAKQPTVYGKTWAAVGIIESFSLFAFVFAILLLS